MATKQPALPPRGKKYFTPAEANAMLPLVRSIIRDIVELARDLRERQDRLSRIKPPERGVMLQAYEEEVALAQGDMGRDEEKMDQFFDELRRLGIELKDPLTGLIDFPAWMDDREVYLCWRLGEPDVAHWHELDAGFAGRRKLPAPTSVKS